jgi:hypothetical protein
VNDGGPRVDARKTRGRRRWGCFERALYCWTERFSPGAWPYVRGREGLWVLTRSLLLLFAVYGGAQEWHMVAIPLATLLGADLVVANTSIALRRDPRPLNVLRSHVLTFTGFVSLPLVFSPYWLWLLEAEFRGSVWDRGVDATWQSVRTMTTTGPEVSLSSSAKILASIETFVGIYFLVIVIATYVSWLKEESAR